MEISQLSALFVCIPFLSTLAGLLLPVRNTGVSEATAETLKIRTSQESLLMVTTSVTSLHCHWQCADKILTKLLLHHDICVYIFVFQVSGFVAK